jgi:hypothetical protein
MLLPGRGEDVLLIVLYMCSLSASFLRTFVPEKLVSAYFSLAIQTSNAPFHWGDSRPPHDADVGALAGLVHHSKSAVLTSGMGRKLRHYAKHRLRPLRRHVSVRRAEINVSGSANSYRARIAMNWKPSARQSGGNARQPRRAAGHFSRSRQIADVVRCAGARRATP